MSGEDDQQRRLTADALAALAGRDFVLAGSGAIREHGISDRPTQDVDLFTASVDRLGSAACSSASPSGPERCWRKEPEARLRESAAAEHQARDLESGLVDFLTTTFALVDADARAALEDFLRHDSEGIFKGPYVRLRLPFRPADAGWRAAPGLDAAGLRPVRAPGRGVRAARSRRPSTGGPAAAADAGHHRHRLRQDRGLPYPSSTTCSAPGGAGMTGIKALMLYPMNALATDQAGRLAGLIAGDPRLAGVTAALYTGDPGRRARR